MKKTIIALACTALFFVAYSQLNKTTSSATSVDPAKDWKLGVALWTFHTVSFSESLDMAKSAGVKYIEPNNFTKTLPELNDSSLMQLSPSGIQKLKLLIEQRGQISFGQYNLSKPLSVATHKLLSLSFNKDVRLACLPEIILLTTSTTRCAIKGLHFLFYFFCL